MKLKSAKARNANFAKWQIYMCSQSCKALSYYPLHPNACSRKQTMEYKTGSLYVMVNAKCTQQGSRLCVTHSLVFLCSVHVSDLAYARHNIKYTCVLHKTNPPCPKVILTISSSVKKPLSLLNLPEQYMDTHKPAF